MLGSLPLRPAAAGRCWEAGNPTLAEDGCQPNLTCADLCQDAALSLGQAVAKPERADRYGILSGFQLSPPPGSGSSSWTFGGGPPWSSCHRSQHHCSASRRACQTVRGEVPAGGVTVGWLSAHGYSSMYTMSIGTNGSVYKVDMVEQFVTCMTVVRRTTDPSPEDTKTYTRKKIIKR